MAEIRAVHECLFCPQTFGTAAAKDDHVLEHFAQETCVECNQNMIRIGGSLYIKHDAVTCVKRAPKTENIRDPVAVDSFSVQNDCQDALTDGKYADGLGDDGEFSFIHNVSVKEEPLNIFHENSGDMVIPDTNNASDVRTGELRPQPNCTTIFESENHLELINTQTQIELMERTTVKYTCEFCGKKLGSKVSLSTHKIRLHSPEDTIFCNNCGRLFSTIEERDTHMAECKLKAKIRKMKKSHPDLRCDLCDQQFTKDATYRLHMKRKHSQPVPKLKCQQCHTTFLKESWLHEHQCTGKKANESEAHSNCFVIPELESPSNVDMQKKTDEEHTCEICGKKLGSKLGLSSHRTLFHSGPDTIFCSVCKRIFSAIDERDEHQVECKLRKKTRYLKSIGKFECDICQRVYGTKSDMHRHMRNKHMPKRATFKCKSCKTKFLREFSLQNHECKGKSIWQDKVPCETCGKFISKYALRVHQIAFHSEENTIFCRNCYKKFPTDADLTAHRTQCKRKQLANQKRQCEICKRILNSFRSLIKHKISLHSEGIIFCTTCVKKFETVEELNAHKLECTLKRKLKKIQKQTQMSDASA